eukprot:CAMPEP_0171081586 /NCGR_PEP_ID=MMETSP0766_2-20121228/16591_1 /TAXON_ID=439317 /ORGANISM="Gambierdiscus australes, Strain CAWD 149" /LENGTH=164 /DNA_ID=CAMNT_0011538897 /DNA_START=169 /DNA_END=660 /DNA_ORIENTATION=-
MCRVKKRGWLLIGHQVYWSLRQLFSQVAVTCAPDNLDRHFNNSCLRPTGWRLHATCTAHEALQSSKDTVKLTPMTPEKCPVVIQRRPHGARIRTELAYMAVDLRSALRPVGVRLQHQPESSKVRTLQHCLRKHGQLEGKHVPRLAKLVQGLEALGKAHKVGNVE